MSDLLVNLKSSLQRHSAAAFMVVSAATALALMDPSTHDAPAFVDAIPTRIAPEQTARLAAVHVQAGTLVQEGDLLATLDTRALELSLQVLRGELAALESTHGVERHDQESILHTVRMELAIAESDLRMAQTSVTSMTEKLDSRTRSAQAGLIAATDVADLRHELALRNAQAERSQVAVDSLRRRMDHLQTTNDGVAVTDAARAAQRDVLLARIAQVEHQLAEGSIRAPFDGRVSQISQAAGATVSPASPILELVPETASHVVACVPEDTALQLAPGAEVRLISTAGANMRATIASIANVVRPSDFRCRGTMHDELWVRPVYLTLDEQRGLPAGSQLRAHFRSDATLWGTMVQTAKAF